MKWKALLVLCGIFLLVFLIYLTTLDRKVYYLDLGDELTLTDGSYGEQLNEYFEQLNKSEKHINHFNKKDLRITDIVRMVEINEKVTINNKEQTIKNALIKADLVTLSVGRNDFIYKIDHMTTNELYDTADEVVHDMEELFELLREYCKEDIIFLGITNDKWTDKQEIFDYLNNNLRLLAEEYSITFYLPQVINYDGSLPTKNSSNQIYNGLKLLVDDNLLK